MWLKHRVDEQTDEAVKAQERMQSIYLAAYCFSLELCENPEIARVVAARVLKSMEGKERSSCVSDWEKPRAVARPDVAKLY
jgi:hypothetical protein